jgi:hypothetical protein
MRFAMNSRSAKSSLAITASSSSLLSIVHRHLSKITVACSALVLATTAAQAAVVNLTTANASGSIGAATFTQFDPQSTGTGVFDAFVQVSPGGNDTSSSAYNTTVNGVFNVGASDQHNRSIFLSDVPVINGSRRFVLDINENNNAAGDQFLSLDNIRLYVGGASNPSTTDLNSATLGTLIYNMDSGANNTVALNYALNAGSGSGDMFFLLSNDLFAGFAPTSVVTLYSAFGADLGTLAPGNAFGLPAGVYGQSDGFEEWGAPGPASTVPDGGSTIALMGGALLFLAGLARRGILIAGI